MTPTEMEDQLKNLEARTTAAEQILPTLATKDDLRAAFVNVATKQDFEDAKRYASILNEATRDDIRLLAEHMLTMRAQLDRIEQRLS